MFKNLFGKSSSHTQLDNSQDNKQLATPTFSKSGTSGGNESERKGLLSKETPPSTTQGLKKN